VKFHSQLSLNQPLLVDQSVSASVDTDQLLASVDQSVSVAHLSVVQLSVVVLTPLVSVVLLVVSLAQLFVEPAHRLVPSALAESSKGNVISPSSFSRFKQRETPFIS